MMYKIEGVVIFLILILPSFSVINENNGFKNNEYPTNIDGKEEVDQIQDDISGGVEKLYGDIQLIQSFKPSRDKITRVEIFLSKYEKDIANLGNIVLSIRENINGEDLVSSSLPPEKVDTRGKWITFDFPDISVTDHKTYYLVCHTSGGSLPMWRNDTSLKNRI